MLRIRELYGVDRRLAFETEEGTLRKYLHRFCQSWGARYELLEPISVGGSGVVFQGKHIEVSKEVAIKFYRPLTSADDLEMVKNEQFALPLMDHPNVVRILDRGSSDEGLSPPLSFIVEPYLSKPRPVQKYLGDLLEPLRQTKVPDIRLEEADDESTVSFDIVKLQEILSALADIMLQWTSALRYIHENQGIVFLDVKPDNAVVDKYGQLFVIDFGSAGRLVKGTTTRVPLQSGKDGAVQSTGPIDVLFGDSSNPGIEPVEGNETINVFYTDWYVHPKLKDKPHQGTSLNRLKAPNIQRSFLRVEFDYYALGRSLLKLLNDVAKVRPHDAPQLSLFRSLLFLATRLLDGENVEGKIPPPPKEDSPLLLSEYFGGLNRADYETLRYTDLSAVMQDLQKELGQWNPEVKVPELQTYSNEVVRLVSDHNTAFTPRVRSIVEHPLFARLKLISQLGLVTLVYPTADHSRFDHMLGTFTFASSYVKSLFNDSQNPIFRNLVDAHDIRAALLATLVHDIGQYPLAHDLEEVNKRIFDHVNMSLLLLDYPTEDSKGRTLAQIITDDKNGWGVDLSLLKQLLGARAEDQLENQSRKMRNFKVDMLSALIDGPIDADKADYIIRDSSQCRIPYGNQLDIDRLLHVLTIAVMRGQYRVTMGVYEKGKASAESFALARYLLFSAVYWHHTSRIIKAMVQYSTAVALGDDALAAKDKVRDKKVIESVQVPLIAFITSLSPPFDRTIRGPMPKPEIDKTRVDAAPDSVVLNALASATNPRTAARDWYPGISWTDWLMLQWIRDYLAKDQPKSRALINGILGRHLYKRIATFSRKNPDDGALLEKLDEMSWIDRKNLCAGVDERIRKIFFEKWSHGKIETESLQSKEKIEQIFDENMVILIDIPNPKAKRGRRSDLPLTVVPELRQKTYSQEAEEPYASDNWVDTLMDSIGPVRVICHPDLEKAIGAMYAQDDRHFEIRKIILAALDELGN